MRRNLIVANWKMYLDFNQSVLLAKKIRDAKRGAEVVIAPSFVALHEVALVLAQSGIDLAAQNMYFEDFGAYTGEISGKDLKIIGCKYVILGHSERRKYFKEDYSAVNKKIVKAIQLGLIPIVCVGENLRERRSGQAWPTIKSQLKEALKNIKKKDKIIVAYEPIWAIGTGHPEDPEDAAKIQQQIKKEFLNSNDRVLYGGSVKAGNFKDFLEHRDIDGLLVGGASASIEEFKEIIK